MKPYKLRRHNDDNKYRVEICRPRTVGVKLARSRGTIANKSSILQCTRFKEIQLVPNTKGKHSNHRLLDGRSNITKVADFGSSRNLGDSGVRDRSDVVRRDACCMLFAPPELARINDGVTWEVKDGSSATLSNKTNVWQVGMLLACCMSHPETDWRDVPQMHWETPEKEQLRFGKKRGRTELSRKQLCHENSKYNSVLINIVKLCLHFDPVKRPSPSSLLRGVQKYMKDAVAGVENYQSVEGEADDDIQPYKLLEKKDDRYKIGKQFD
ncbi:hypothetical protein D6D18_03920 [Aureobasidium pullulans]|nr:hypothetical protein D6D18_03920 [Aureobasidium pullulans]